MAEDVVVRKINDREFYEKSCSTCSLDLKFYGIAQHGAALLHCEERETSQNIPRGICGAKLRLLRASCVID